MTHNDSADILDPERTHLDILRDLSDLFTRYQPKKAVTMRCQPTGDYDCAECGFPLSGNIKDGIQHATYKEYKSSQPCKYLRALNELEAWIRVEEELESNRL